MEMMFYLENEFDIALSDQEVASVHTVGDTINLVKRKTLLVMQAA